MTPKLRLAASAAALALAALVAACSAGGGSAGAGGSPVASLAASGQAGHTAAAQLTQEQSDLDMIHFARCMQHHGVAMSDPFQMAGHNGLSINLPVQDAATRPAYAACNHFMQPINQAKEAGARPILAAELPALTRYAECMRAHDISMLDPAGDGSLSLGNVPGMSSDFGRATPQFHAADSACRHLLPAGVSDDGTGP